MNTEKINIDNSTMDAIIADRKAKGCSPCECTKDRVIKVVAHYQAMIARVDAVLFCHPQALTANEIKLMLDERDRLVAAANHEMGGHVAFCALGHCEMQSIERICQSEASIGHRAALLADAIKKLQKIDKKLDGSLCLRLAKKHISARRDCIDIICRYTADRPRQLSSTEEAWILNRARALDAQYA